MARVLPQHIFYRLQINGSQPVTLDRRFLASLKITNTLMSGAAQATFDCYLRPGATWPWNLRAMDRIQVDAAVLAAPGSPTDSQWQTIYTGVLTDVPLVEAADAGFHVTLQAANVWHELEVSTESPQQLTLRYKQANMLVGDFLVQEAQLGGFPNLYVEAGPDINTGLIALDAVDPNGFAFNPQYQTYAQVIAALAKMAGRELYADEYGFLNYRPSHYYQDADGDIPVERLISASASVDTDDGLINRVEVRWGLQESQFTAGHAPPVGQEIPTASGGAYDRAHYRDRLLIVPAPWITRQADADWLAQWTLSWGMSNTRPAVVALNFWPEVRLGNLYRLAWPAGKPTIYYVSSVAHQITVGGPAITSLGLTYGRPPGFKYDIPVAPPGFGVHTTNAATGTPLQVTGAGWTVTYYTPSDPNQAPLPQYTDDPANGPYLLTAYGAREYQSGWRQAAGQPMQDYSVRPCAFDPSYAVPELGNVTLTAGDRLLLADGVVVECRDTGGAVAGRHLDVFYWDAPSPPPPSPQTAQYLKVANYTGTLPDIPGYGAPTPPGNPTPPGFLAGPVTGEMGDPMLADFAAGVAQTLINTGTYFNDAPSITAFGGFCVSEGSALANGDGNAQCVLFARFCLLRNGYPAPRFAAGKLAGELVNSGYIDVTGRYPAEGDVVYFDAPGSGATPGSNVSVANGAGHVAIVTAVTDPNSQGTGGSITVAQANCTQQIQQFPLSVKSAYYLVGGNVGFGPWLGTVRPRHAG